MAAGPWSAMRHPAVIQGMKNEPWKQVLLSIISLKKGHLKTTIYMKAGKFNDCKTLSLQLSAICNNSRHSYTFIIASKSALVCLVLGQAHSYGSLTETLMRAIFNTAVTKITFV